MTVTATGIRAVAAGKLATMISQSSTFIARTGALAAAGALLHVHYPWLHKNRADKRPCAIITPLGYQSDLSSNDTYSRGGTFALRMLDTARYDDKTDAMDDFTNFIDGVIADLEENSRTNTTGLLTIQGIRGEPPAEVDATNNAEYVNHYAADFEIDWAPFQG